MNARAKKCFRISGILFAIFAVFTLMAAKFDVRPIGPQQSEVGFAALNGLVFDCIGVHLFWYELTDWLGLAAVAVMLAFAVWGMCQLVKRRSVRKVDRNILLLGAFYILLLAFYVGFELLAINCRPVLLGENPEASYPSSHTVLAVCVMSTAALQLRSMLPARKRLCRTADIAAAAIIAVTVIGRLVSGVHWFTDILGGLILSAALVALYRGAVETA